MTPKKKLKLPQGQGSSSNFFSKMIISEQTHTDNPIENQSDFQITSLFEPTPRTSTDTDFFFFFSFF